MAGYLSPNCSLGHQACSAIRGFHGTGGDGLVFRASCMCRIDSDLAAVPESCDEEGKAQNHRARAKLIR